MITGHYHTSITVSDLDRSIAFYTDNFGFKVERRFDSYGPPIEHITGIVGAHLQIAHLLLGTFDLELIQYLAPPGAQLDTSTQNVGTAHIAFWTDDVADTYGQLKAKGVRFTGSFHYSDEGWPSPIYLLDPDGFTLELVQLRASIGERIG